MPNWVFNTVNVKNKETIAKYLTEEENGSVNFDFEKIIPMPKELEIDSGSSTADGVVLYLTKNLSMKTTKAMKDTYREVIGNPFMRNDFDEYRKNIEDAINDESNVLYTDEKRAELYELGKTAVSNFYKYGATDWYYWRLKNWGVKWNAGETYVDDSGTQVNFETPWGIPTNIFIEMSKQNPEEVIDVYSEEETGWWVRSRYVAGKEAILEEGDQPEEDDD